MVISLKDMNEAAERAVQRIGFEEAQDVLKNDEAVPVDVREESEFHSLPRLPGAISMPRSRLEFRCDPASANFEPALKSGKMFLVYCQSGGRALLAAKTLTDMGVENVRLLGGIDDWVAIGGRVEEHQGRLSTFG